MKVEVRVYNVRCCFFTEPFCDTNMAFKIIWDTSILGMLPLTVRQHDNIDLFSLDAIRNAHYIVISLLKKDMFQDNLLIPKFAYIKVILYF
jgi:hypothetical protein